MRLRKLRSRDTSEDATFDLNLAPMMDMLVSIVPFMLLSVSFLTVMLINVTLPVPVAQALEQDRKDQKREVVIKVNISQKSSFNVEVKDISGAVSRYSIASSGGQLDYKSLHKKLVEVKSRFPKIFRIEVNPDAGVDFKAMVETMDAARNMEKGDPTILIENTATPLLFPDVVISNLMG